MLPDKPAEIDADLICIDVVFFPQVNVSNQFTLIHHIIVFGDRVPVNFDQNVLFVFELSHFLELFHVLLLS